MSYIETNTPREKEIYSAGWEEGYSDCLAMFDDRNSNDWHRCEKNYNRVMGYTQPDPNSPPRRRRPRPDHVCTVATQGDQIMYCCSDAMQADYEARRKREESQ